MLQRFKFFIFLCLCAAPCFGVASEPLANLSLEERVGQLLMVHFRGEVANEEVRILIQEIGVGGIIYYNWANGLHSPEQVYHLSKELQKLAQKNRFPIPLFIAADQEGGIVARLQNGFTIFPGNKALAVTEKPKLAKAAASAMGRELQAVGINMNLAPVVDVNSNPRNPVIGIRSFGDNPESVLAFGKEALQGYKQAGIIATLKHFPGHGDVEIDSHEELPVIHKSLEALQKMELLPFAHLASSADAIMTAHLLVPALDSKKCSTLSEKTLTFLRNTLGFQGVIVSDSLVMEGVLKTCGTVDEAAIQALQAGCDVLILGGKHLIGGQRSLELTFEDIQRIKKSIVKAVKEGRVSLERLNNAVERILELKGRYIDFAIAKEGSKWSPSINRNAHQAIAKEIATGALKVNPQGCGRLLPLSEKRLLVLAPEILSASIQQTDLLSIAKISTTCFYPVTPSLEDLDAAKQCAEAADVLLICCYNAWKIPSQASLIHALLDSGKPVILLVLRDPLDAALFAKAALTFTTFSPTTVSIQAVCDHLKERY